MKTIRIGLIGWGFMGKIHTHALRSIPVFYPDRDFDIVLKCVCTRRTEAAAQAAHDFGYERYCTDYRDLLAMDDIDVVSICTPNGLHEEMAIAALRAGKAVYLDKPVAENGESALRIVSAAEETGLPTRVAFQNRYLPAIIRAKQLIDEGRIGNVLQFEARYLHSGSVDAGKKVGWKEMVGGGVTLDMGSHVLDLTTYLIGFPERVLCRTRKLYPTRPGKDGIPVASLGDDHMIAMLEMPGGAIGTVEASKIATGSEDDLTLEIRGDKGALRFSMMDPNYLDFYDLTTDASPVGGMRGYTRIAAVGRFPGGDKLTPKNPVGWERTHTHSYYSFLKEITDHAPAACSIADGARVQALMDDLFASDSTGEWIVCGG